MDVIIYGIYVFQEGISNMWQMVFAYILFRDGLLTLIYSLLDVEALFTSMPIEPAISIIKKHLEEDKDLHHRTTMTVKHISCLLEFVSEPHI